jgi:hypothetical protein
MRVESDSLRRRSRAALGPIEMRRILTVFLFACLPPLAYSGECLLDDKKWISEELPSLTSWSRIYASFKTNVPGCDDGIFGEGYTEAEVGAVGKDAPVGVHGRYAVHSGLICRTAVYVTRSYGGVGGGAARLFTILNSGQWGAGDILNATSDRRFLPWRGQ